MNKINFIATGCSFTAGIISLPHSSPQEWNDRGSVWPHFCFAKTDTAQGKFVNLALSGGGNTAAIYNLIYYLETNRSSLNKTNTIIGFNITGLDRIDRLVDLSDPDINQDMCCIDTSGLKHPSTDLGFGWVTKGPPGGLQRKNYINGCLAILQGLCYLDHAGYEYFFMTMNDEIYTYAPAWFQQCLNDRKDRWVTFNDAQSMLTFIKKSNLTKSDTDWHPSISGHKLIAQHVLDFCHRKYKTQFFDNI